MKIIFLFIIALLLATSLAYQTHLDPGFALLSHGQTSVETSLAVLAFIISCCFIIFHLILRSLLSIKAVPSNMAGWNSKRKQNRAQKNTIKGLLDSVEGNWQRSEKLLSKGVKDSDTPLLNYLSAAQAAQSQGAYQRRDDYLFKAGEALPEQTQAIFLTRAKLQVAAGQLEQALATLRQLFNLTPEHPIVLSLLLQTYTKLKDWHAVYKLLPVLRKNRHLDPTTWQAVEKQTLLFLLTGPSNSELTVEEVWNKLSKQQKLAPEYLALYAKYKIAEGEQSSLLKLLEKSLNAQLDPLLLSLYTQLEGELSAKIKQLEKWLAQQPSAVDLLNSLAILLIRIKSYQKAQQYLDQSLQNLATSKTYFLLGQLSEAQNEPAEKSANFYRTGLELINNQQLV